MNTTPPSSERATPPSWFQSPATHRGSASDSSAAAALPGSSGHPRHPSAHPPPHGGYYHSDDEHDISIAEGNNDAGRYGDEHDEDGESREREPLLSPRHGGGGHASTSSAVLSPSTGSSSLLRRSFRGGIRAKRGCTDIVFLGFFVAYWAGMIALGVYAFTRESNVSFAKYIKDGVDFQGQACGTGRFVYFPDFRANPDFGFCVDACPETAGQDLVVELPLSGHGDVKDDNDTLPLTPVTFKSYATHPWTYVCAPAEGMWSL